MAKITAAQKNPILAPLSSTKEVELLTALQTNALEAHPSDFKRRAIPASRALSDKQRTTLEARRSELRQSLTPTPGEEAEDTIAVIIARPKQYGLSEEEAYLKAKLYAASLRNYPTWAISKAERRFGDGSWQCRWTGEGIPESHQVAAECRHILFPVEAELARLNAVLDAEVYEDRISVEEREKVNAHVNAAIAALRTNSAIAELKEEQSPIESALKAQANDQLRKCIESAPNAEYKTSWTHLSSIDPFATTAQINAGGEAYVNSTSSTEEC